jgi:2-polyprenyl-3-methyl-5-hydroxy-6-metoxy-1,4-benzoquinol methylase
MTAQLETEVLDLAKVEAFANKVGIDQAAGYHAVLVYLGDRLGIWRTLASAGAVTSEELARRSGLAERYVREWLGAQAAAGYLDYDAADATFTLSAEHAMVLAEEDSPAAEVAGFEVIAAVWASADRLAHAYATGEGVGWHEHDPRLFTGVDRFFRTLYRTSLLTEWLPAVDGLVERLESGARVIDVGCGLGSATILMAQAFPASTFVGIDYHQESVRQATAAAEEAGVAGRVQFEVGDASSYGGTYDVVCFFDAVHDMGDPVGALGHARSVLAEDGQVFAVEPFAHDDLADAVGSPVALTYFAASSCLCVPNSMSQGGAALGAQAGPARLTAAFADAGFTTARVAAATPYNLVLEARA